MKTSISKRTLLLIPVYIIILFSCKNTLEDQDIQIIPLAQTINSVQDKDTEIMAFKNVSFIKISTQNYLMYDKMRFAGIFNNQLFLYDKNCIISADISTGDVISQINRKGNGPEEYLSILSVSLDAYDQTLLVYDPDKNRITRYSFNGDFKGIVQLEESGCTCVMADNNYLVCYSPDSSIKNLYGIYDRNWNIIRKSNLMQSSVKSRIMSFNIPQTFNNGCYIRQTYKDTLFCINLSSEHPAVHLQRGKYRMPDDYRKSLTEMAKVRDRYIEINDVNIAGNHLFVGYFYDNKLYRDVWDLVNSILLSRAVINNPNSQYGFPILIDGKIIYCWCDFVYNNSVFCFLPYWEAIKLFPHLTQEDNPIIIKIDL